MVQRKTTNASGRENAPAHKGDENVGSLFQPDTLLSAQYFDTLRRRTLLEPEKRLMLAVLDDAINCYQDNLFARSTKNKRLFDEAEEWIVAADGDGIFCFDSVCESLGFNPEFLRQGLLRWKTKNLQVQPHRKAWDEKRLAR